jgi:hypothetical protein
MLVTSVIMYGWLSDVSRQNDVVCPVRKFQFGWSCDVSTCELLIQFFFDHKLNLYMAFSRNIGTNASIFGLGVSMIYFGFFN